MNANNDFMTVVTNKIKTPSSFYKNSVCCLEPIGKIVEYAILQSRYPCNDFYFDYAEMREKNYITDFFKINDALPVMFISQDCFDIGAEIIEEIFEQYKNAGDIAAFDKKDKLFAYIISPEKKREAVENFENLYAYAEDGKIKKYDVDYTVPSSLKELREISRRMQEQIFEAHEKDGVQFASFDGVAVSPYAKLYDGIVIYSGTVIRGNSIIGANTVLGPDTLIDTSIIGENCVINSTQIYSSTLDDDIKTGPYCHIRPNCRIESGVHLGNFIEVKNSKVGKDTKAGHFTYIGDSDVGERVNFGCGSITANYDGKDKHRCIIGNDVFIGCNTNLVAPVTVGDGAYTAAGSTITIDIPPDALAISRAREQRIIDGWVEKFKGKK